MQVPGSLSSNPWVADSSSQPQPRQAWLLTCTDQLTFLQRKLFSGEGMILSRLVMLRCPRKLTLAASTKSLRLGGSNPSRTAHGGSSMLQPCPCA